MSIYLMPESDSPEHIRQQDAEAAEDAWRQAQAAARMLAFVFLYMAIVVGVVVAMACGYVRQDRVDEVNERQHVEQLRRDGRLPNAIR